MYIKLPQKYRGIPGSCHYIRYSKDLIKPGITVTQIIDLSENRTYFEMLPLAVILYIVPCTSLNVRIYR
jgi:hypothetical protein